MICRFLGSWGDFVSRISPWNIKVSENVSVGLEYWTISLTRETLMKMNRDVLAGMVLDYKERFGSTLSARNDELNELKTDFCKPGIEPAISRNVNEKLTQQFILVERKYWANWQWMPLSSACKFQGFLSLFKIMTRKAAFLKSSVSVTPQWIRQILMLGNVSNRRLGQRRSSLNFPKVKMCLVFYNVKRN